MGASVLIPEGDMDDASVSDRPFRRQKSEGRRQKFEHRSLRRVGKRATPLPNNPECHKDRVSHEGDRQLKLA